MKRFLIFAGLVPPVALAIFLAPEATAIETLGFAFLTLAYVYLIGLIPASLTAAVDWLLSGQSVHLRMAGTAIFATILTELMANQLLGVSMSLHVGLIGAIPAAVCSFLSGEPIKPAAT